MYNIYIEEKKQKIEKEIKRKELNQLNYTQRYQSKSMQQITILLLILYRRSIIIGIQLQCSCQRLYIRCIIQLLIIIH